MRVQELIAEITLEFEQGDIFFGHGAFSAYDESVWLVCSILNIPFAEVSKSHKTTVPKNKLLKINNIKNKRIKERIPLAYLLKEAWLKELNFFIDDRVLVPRSLIADLADSSFYPWVNCIEEVKSVLDLCCGSGCLGILLAKRYPHLNVDLIDISKPALEVAKINIEKYSIASQVNIIQSNLFSNCFKTYDLIITNPPYVNSVSMKKLPKEYQKEPKLALASGDDGLDLTRQIVHESKKYLNENGKIFVEIGHNRDEVEKVFNDINIWWVDTPSGSDYIFMIDKKDLP